LASPRTAALQLKQSNKAHMGRKDIVNQISQAIRRVDPTATAILYGSEARGDARPD